MSKVEVELRAKIAPGILKKFAGKVLKESKEHDLYFRYETDTEKTWIARIRNRGSKYSLTYKSSKQFGEGAWDEVNVHIDRKTAEQLRSFFSSNSHNLEVEIIKRRKTIKIDGMEVNVDKIEGLGTYIEAEIMADMKKVDDAKEKIRSLFKKLGIPDKEITDKGYVWLMRERKDGATS